MRPPFSRSSRPRCFLEPSFLAPRAPRPPAPLPGLLRLGPPASGAWLIAGLALGCGAGTPQLAESLYLLPDANGDGCAAAVTRIEAIDEPTPLGFTAIDALMRLDGPRSSPLVWLEPAPNPEYLLTLGPESGLSTLAIDVRAQDGPILHRFRTPLLTAPEDTACDTGALEIPISITLESAAQGLSESFDATLEARTPYRGRIEKRFEPGSLRGSLGLASVASLDPARSFWLGALRFEAEVWEGGSLGALSVELGVRHAKAAATPGLPPEPPEQPGSIATWPSAAACEGGGSALPSSAKVLGFSVDDVLAELRGGGPRRATWADGSETPLEVALAAEGSEPCQTVGESLSFGALLHTRTAGGLDVRSLVQVDALDAGGRVGAIRIESAEPDAPSPLASGSSQDGRNTGSEGYTAVLVGVEWMHDGARDTGSLSLRGVDARSPDASGAYPSTALASAHW
jgi:hypothetical protein